MNFNFVEKVRGQGCSHIWGAIILVPFLLGACSSGKSPTIKDPVTAMQNSESSFQVGKSKERYSDLAAIEQFDTEVDGIYRLGPGDQVTIEVWDRPELSGSQLVGPDGQITIPVAGTFSIAGLSRDEAIERVKQELERYYLDIAVDLRVDAYNSNVVLVLGRVAKPGAIQFETSPTLLEAITLAGGLPVGGIGADKAALTRCAVFRGRDRVIWIELSKLLKGENLRLNIRLKSRDLVYVPDADDQLVYLMGEVINSGAYQLTPDMSLLDALNRAGGPSRDASDLLFLIRSTDNSMVEIPMSDLLTRPADLDYQLVEGDVIYIPERGLSKVGYVLEKFSPLSGFLILGSAIAR